MSDDRIYIPQEWIDEANDFTPITAERMNHIEQGIAAIGDSVSRIDVNSVCLHQVTRTLASGDTSALLLTDAEFLELTGVPYASGNGFVGAMNANGNSTHLESVTYVNGRGFCAVFKNATAGTIRITLLVAARR